MAGILEQFAASAAKKDGWLKNGRTLAAGSGIKQAINYVKEMNPLLLQPGTVAQLVGTLPGLLGGYPTNTTHEQGVDAFMFSLFAVLFLGTAFIWLNNVFRGHHFYLHIGLVFFCAAKIIGYALRYQWSKDITQVDIGIASTVFIDVAQLVVLSMNHVFAHRIFTWRHPETGNSWWLNLVFDIMYFFVVMIIIMAIIGQTMPYTMYLTPHGLKVTQNVTMAASILNLVYALIPFQLIMAAYMFKPGKLTAEPWKKRQEGSILPPVYQANWIESTNIFYYVPRGAQSHVYKDEPASQAIRVIPTREAPSDGFHDTHNEPLTHPKSPSIFTAIAIVLFSSTIFLLNTCFRVAAVFGTYYGDHKVAGTPTQSTSNRNVWTWKSDFFPFKPECIWVFYGGLEALVVVLFLVMRVDLRFYIPDMPRSAKKNPHPYSGSDYNEPKSNLDANLDGTY